MMVIEEKLSVLPALSGFRQTDDRDRHTVLPGVLYSLLYSTTTRAVLVIELK